MPKLLLVSKLAISQILMSTVIMEPDFSLAKCKHNTNDLKWWHNETPVFVAMFLGNITNCISLRQIHVLLRWTSCMGDLFSPCIKLFSLNFDHLEDYFIWLSKPARSIIYIYIYYQKFQHLCAYWNNSQH